MPEVRQHEHSPDRHPSPEIPDACHVIHGQAVKSLLFSVGPVIRSTLNDIGTGNVQLRCHLIVFSVTAVSLQGLYVSFMAIAASIISSTASQFKESSVTILMIPRAQSNLVFLSAVRREKPYLLYVRDIAKPTKGNKP